MNDSEYISSITLPGEEWRPVKNFEGKYMVSSFGRVAALSFPIEAGKLHYSRKQHLLSVHRYVNGYYGTALSVGKNHHKGIKIHRLVADAFIPNPDNLPHINHKDEDKSNNRVENLEWCTVKYNVNYGTGCQRSARTRIATLCNCKRVAKLDEDGNVLVEYNGLRYAAEDIGRDYSAITYSIKHGTRCAGYHWRFL